MKKFRKVKGLTRPHIQGSKMTKMKGNSHHKHSHLLVTIQCCVSLSRMSQNVSHFWAGWASMTSQAYCSGNMQVKLWVVPLNVNTKDCVSLLKCCRFITLAHKINAATINAQKSMFKLIVLKLTVILVLVCTKIFQLCVYYVVFCATI